MTASATELFAWFEWQRAPEWRRYEITSASFALLRRGVHHMVRAMFDDSESSYEASHLRQMGVTWLTTPVRFDCIGLSDFAFIGPEQALEGRWGSQVNDAWGDVKTALSRLAGLENPLRREVERLVSEARQSSRRLRIYCRRTSTDSFRSIPMVAALEETDQACFIHSIADYRRRDPFDELIIVGPMWSQGSFAIAPAILNAARYATLHQLVWAGLADDPNCALDPVVAAVQPPPASQNANLPAPNSGIFKPSTAVSVRAEGDAETEAAEMLLDELSWWRESARPSIGNVQAVVLDLGEEGAVAYRPHGTVTVIRESDATPVVEEAEAWTLSDANSFLVLHDLNDVDFGETRASDGQLSSIWKAQLRLQHMQDASGLERRLRQAGLDLDTLRGCLRHWLAPTTTVIHAPKERRHFEILVRVLGIEDHLRSFPGAAKANWSRQAWMEVRRSRGERVQFGMEGERIRMEEAAAVVKTMLPTVVNQLRGKNAARCDIPPGLSLEGSIVCLRIIALESGFRVPDVKLAVVTSMEELEQWRV